MHFVILGQSCTAAPPSRSSSAAARARRLRVASRSGRAGAPALAAARRAAQADPVDPARGRAAARRRRGRRPRAGSRRARPSALQELEERLAQARGGAAADCRRRRATPRAHDVPPPVATPPPRDVAAAVPATVPGAGEDAWRPRRRARSRRRGDVNVPERDRGSCRSSTRVARKDCARAVPQLNSFAAQNKRVAARRRTRSTGRRAATPLGRPEPGHLEVLRRGDRATRRATRRRRRCWAQGNLFVEHGRHARRAPRPSKLIRDYPNSDEAGRARPDRARLVRAASELSERRWHAAACRGRLKRARAFLSLGTLRYTRRRCGSFATCRAQPERLPRGRPDARQLRRRAPRAPGDRRARGRPRAAESAGRWWRSPSMPHPLAVLAPDRAPRMHPVAARPPGDGCATLGVDTAVLQRFTRAFAATRARGVRRATSCSAHSSCCTSSSGYNVNFGRDRAGTARRCARSARASASRVDTVGPVRWRTASR